MHSIHLALWRGFVSDIMIVSSKWGDDRIQQFLVRMLLLFASMTWHLLRGDVSKPKVTDLAMTEVFTHIDTLTAGTW